ncbi:MAG: hypothetical protein AB1413_01140 [Thermodesulfobacteriota bacterium]
MSTQEKRTIHRPPRRLLMVLLLALAAAAGVAAWWFLLRAPASPPPPTASVAPAPAPLPAAPESAATDQAAPAAPSPASERPAPAGQGTAECQQLGEEITAFFNRLDREDYIEPRKLQGGSQAYICGLMAKLFANPPVVVGETNTFFTILSNTVHFYRILKKDDVLLVRDILLNESENIEPLMALFYRWSLRAPECPAPNGINLAMPLPGLYEYAGFFLNTLGGRSYLFRRESRLRLLVKYYSVLVLDRANSQRLNSHGIDIRPSLASLGGEMRNAKSLKDRAAYLATLTELQAKYRSPAGAAGTASLVH